MFHSGRPGAFHNGVSRLAEADIDTAIAAAQTYFHGVSWLWWCGDDSRPGVAAERGATPACTWSGWIRCSAIVATALPCRWRRSGRPVRPARSRAQPIYERLGFVTVSRYQLFSL